MKDVEAKGPLLMTGEGFIEIRVRVQPRASSEGFAGVVDRTLVVRVTEPPVEGRANRALQSVLAKRLRIPKRAVEIISGKTSRIKRVRLHGVTPEHLAASI
jgi:uncharacterized protein (TIGR00251 family)